MKNEIAFHCINWSALQGFPPIRKTMSPQLKNYDNFSRVWDHQSAADTSFALFSAMNEKQRALSLKYE